MTSSTPSQFSNHLECAHSITDYLRVRAIRQLHGVVACTHSGRRKISRLTIAHKLKPVLESKYQWNEIWQLYMLAWNGTLVIITRALGYTPCGTYIEAFLVICQVRELVATPFLGPIFQTDLEPGWSSRTLSPEPLVTDKLVIREDPNMALYTVFSDTGDDLVTNSELVV